MKLRRQLGSGQLRAGALALFGLSAAVALAGCGEISNTITPKRNSANQLTVELAAPPDAYDVGLYAAQALGYFKNTDLNVKFVTPSPGQNPLTMLHDGLVPVAISSEPSVFLARNQDEPVVAVGAMVHAPLSQIPVTVPILHLPTGGASIGGTGATETSTNPTKSGSTTKTTTTRSTTTTTTGTTTTGTTTTGTTTTGTGTTTTGTTPSTTTTTPTPAQVPTGAAWPAKLQALLGQSTTPTYDAVVIVVRKGTIVDHAPVIRRFVQAVARGYAAVRTDPRAGVNDLIAADPGLLSERRVLLATVRTLLPYFFPSTGDIWGYEKETEWNAFGTWMQKQDLISNPNAITDASTNELLAGEGI